MIGQSKQILWNQTLIRALLRNQDLSISNTTVNKIIWNIRNSCNSLNLGSFAVSQIMVLPNSRCEPTRSPDPSEKRENLLTYWENISLNGIKICRIEVLNVILENITFLRLDKMHVYHRKLLCPIETFCPLYCFIQIKTIFHGI